MLVCQFRFFKETDNKFQVTWKLINENDDVVDSGVKPYCPLRGPIKTMNEAKSKIKDALYAQMIYAHPGQKIRLLCINPKSDFLTKQQLYRLKHGLEPVGQLSLPVPERTDEMPQYEVACVSGTWTIKKHDTPYYTEQEAKTELFKRIVNGE